MESIKPIKSPSLRTASREVVNVEGNVTLFVRIGDLLVRACFEIFENIPVDVLIGRSFIDQCIRGLFPTERKVVPDNRGQW